MADQKQVASLLKRLADLMELDGENSFKVNAYRRAARAVENSRVALNELEGGPEALPGVGKGTATVIKEIMETGRLEQLEALRQKLPKGLPELMNIPGLGPKSIYSLHSRLGVTDLDELERAGKEKQIRKLPGFGEKKEKNILEEILRYRKRPTCHLLVDALRVAQGFLDHLRAREDVIQAEMAGSLRRMKETVKDIDLVVATECPAEVGNEIVSMPEVSKVISHGDTKVSVWVSTEEFEVQVDVRLVPPKQFITTLHHFTGSKEHNVRIRQRAKEFGWKVSEYGIYDPDTGNELTLDREEALYHQLQLPYVIPEMREDRGEFDINASDLPKPLTIEQYRGDLHMHTRWSDGTSSVREMALAAQELGYEYICITDHSQSLKVAGGLSVDDLKRQREEIEQVNEELKGITVLAGVEMDILPDGQLDYPDEVLRELDLVIASIHSSFHQDKETMTRRILQAVEYPYIHVIAHPTGRIINRRDSYQVDLDQVFEAAARTGTALELNANPHRLDLSDLSIKKANEIDGLHFSINTDAHSPQAFRSIELGLATARRGWLEAKDVINTYPLDQLRKWLHGKKN